MGSWRNCQMFSKELYHFTFLPLMCMSPTCSMSAVRMFCRTQDPLFTKYILYIDESIFKAWEYKVTILINYEWEFLISTLSL